MGHPEVDNQTPFIFEALYLMDEETRPLLTAVVKGTFEVGRDRRCVRAEKQLPLNIGGECWGEDPATSSYKFEPEVAFVKPATDVVLIGHAYAERNDTREMRVSLKVGSLAKELAVFGDRLWYRSMGMTSMTKPVPFEKIPLQYERAFGGWDRSNADPRKHACETRNPVGTGFRVSGFQDEIRLPNLEDPRAVIKSLGDKPPPAGFGFLSPHWQPRAALAGTFDAAWSKHRSPLLPEDFDRRHMNAASPGLIAPAYLRGNETVTAVGVHPNGVFSFALPGVAPPPVQVSLVTGASEELEMALDTVIIEPDDRRVQLLWRGHLVLSRGPHDVAAVQVGVKGSA